MLASLLRSFFEKENIEFYASCPISELRVTSPRRLPENMTCATVFLIPYNRNDNIRGNVSRYAIPRDYHVYIREFSERLSEHLSLGGYNLPFLCAADTSPIDEHDAAVKLKLGFRGKNHLVINEKYGSYIFIGSVFTCEPLDLRGMSATERTSCMGCGKCIFACPSKSLESGDFSECVSALTQAKKLSEKQELIVARHNLCWGCDICQEVCPHNKGAAESPIEFFSKKRIPFLSSEILSEMSDEEFSERAFSWRGRAVPTRNLKLCEDYRNSIAENVEKINTGDPQ